MQLQGTLTPGWLSHRHHMVSVRPANSCSHIVIYLYSGNSQLPSFLVGPPQTVVPPVRPYFLNGGSRAGIVTDKVQFRTLT